MKFKLVKEERGDGRGRGGGGGGGQRLVEVSGWDERTVSEGALEQVSWKSRRY